jgi:hypothetical protein
MFHQDWNVLASLAQWWQRDRQDIEPVVQIFAELALGDQLLQVTLATRDDPDVDRHHSRPTEALDGTILQHAEQLHLHRQRHVVNVIEEKRAAFRQFETARSIFDRPSEGAPLVTKQFRFDQGLREQSAAHRNEGSVFAAAGLMDEGGGHLFPRAAFARDEHRAIAVADDAQKLEDRPHSSTAADDNVRQNFRLHNHGDSVRPDASSQTPESRPEAPFPRPRARS